MTYILLACIVVTAIAIEVRMKKMTEQNNEMIELLKKLNEK